MRKMRTAEEMLAYYREHKDPKKKKGFFDTSWPDYDDRRRDFEFAEFLLEPDEYVFSFFWGYIYIYKKEFYDNETRWIYIFTNKRLISICADNKGIKAIDYTDLKNVIFIPNKNEIFFDIDGWYREFSGIIADVDNLEFMQHEIAEVMPYIREIQEKEAQKKKFSGSPAEEIRRFKELCDDGIITEEEFEDRKRELLKFKYVD
ncbi:SHOCT domain-containing protein [Ihubacter sp. rT4E-8]|uniref:SHOCT domain-containing protein n=1 Tax=Ihubacter sp. rT4E-8 TaxID=3242369 RepID=UPI003CF459E9